jgi:hypothetical protein
MSKNIRLNRLINPDSKLGVNIYQALNSYAALFPVYLRLKIPATGLRGLVNQQSFLFSLLYSTVFCQKMRGSYLNLMF